MRDPTTQICDSLLLPRAEHLTNVIKLPLPLDWLISLESEPFGAHFVVRGRSIRSADRRFFDGLPKPSFPQFRKDTGRVTGYLEVNCRNQALALRSAGS